MQDNHLVILLEDIQGKLQGLAEAATVTNDRLTNIEQTITIIPKLAADVEIIKTVQAEQGRELRHIEKYLTAQGMPARA